jgi:murein L,D-transpeptidase YcbB/YkuD
VNGLRLSLLACAALLGCDRAPEPAPPPRARLASAATFPPVAVGPEIAGFYAARGNRPLWVTKSGPRPEAEAAVAAIADARFDGLDPADYGASELQQALDQAKAGDPRALAHFELLLLRGFAAYVRDLRVPKGNPLLQAEPDLAPAVPAARALLESLAAAPRLADGVAQATRMNPLYAALRHGYARWAESGAPGDEAVIRANLARARAIPASQGKQIIVDTGSARLWRIEGERVAEPMRVIVGKSGMETPMLASRITHLVLNPYWNVPPDLARQRAKKVVNQGPGAIAAERMQILSDWSDAARSISASAVSWGAVASGKQTLRLRQLPGGGNVMGAMKFMMANRLGIYLHDFPDKSLFAREDRRLSSGCVRLADAPALAAWLFGGRAPAPRGGGPEQRVDLPEPVPVYLTYLTVLPGGPQGLTFQGDPYRRDRQGGGPAPKRAAED